MPVILVLGDFSVQCGNDLVAGQWNATEMQASSTLREMLAVKCFLLSFIDKLSRCSIKWFRDNQNVLKTISCGSGRDHL